MSVRAMIVDDERLARARLRSLLARHPELCVVAEADSVENALAALAPARPDVVFLDVQMPGESGFDLLERAPSAFRVVFVTAFDHYAVRAFEVNALDYLLKPVQADRLAAAIDRLQSPAPGAVPVPGLTLQDSLFLSFGGRPRFVRLSAIRSITAAGAYSEVTAADGARSLVLRPLGEWESRLPAKTFIRIHRSAIVNVDHVERMEDAPGYRCHVYLSGEAAPLVMSRRRASQLRRAQS